jgi:integrase
MEYVDHLRQRAQRKEISPSTAKTMLQPVKTFTHAFRDVHQSIDWDRITKAMPKEKRFSGDRIPTLEELRKVVDYPDRRIKAVVYTMCSSGIRIGAWQYLKWKHITPVYNPKNPQEVIAAKLTVYAGEPEEHFTFITGEAYRELEKYIEFRKLYGEQITGESWVLRDYFKTADVKRKSPVGGNYGKATEPKRIHEKSLARVMIRAWNEQGIRDTLQEGGRGAVRRHEFKTAHSFRKYFKTRAEQVMNRLNVEYLLGHSIGLNSNYYRPTEQELLQDYLKAVPMLTISEDVTTLKKQQEVLEKKDEEQAQELLKIRQDYQAANELVVKAVNQTQEMVKRYESQQAQMAKLQETINRLEKEMEELEEEKRK